MSERDLNELWDAICYLQRKQVEISKKVERQTDIIEQICAQDCNLEARHNGLNRKVDYHAQRNKAHLKGLHKDQELLARYVKDQNRILQKMAKEMGVNP